MYKTYYVHGLFCFQGFVFVEKVAEGRLSCFVFFLSIHLGFCVASTSLRILIIKINNAVASNKKPKTPKVMPSANCLVVGELFVLETTVESSDPLLSLPSSLSGITTGNVKRQPGAEFTCSELVSSDGILLIQVHVFISKMAVSSI